MYPKASLSVWIIVSLTSCATPYWQKVPHDRRFQQVPPPKLHQRPQTSRSSEWKYITEQTTFRPLGRALSPIYWVDKVSGGPEALDINNFDEVLDSTWFTNRLGRGQLSVEDVIRGPSTINGPAPGPLVVLNGKVSGASPGLKVKDRLGRVFIAKFDPPAFPGLASSAELITTKILYAAGYNVPENYVRRFSVEDLVLSPDARESGPEGHIIPMTPESLRDLVQHANPTLGGQVQALFSRIIEGEPVGPFNYHGTRFDDPNDRVPHERRRSLRAYRWFCAWTNNTDTRASNSLDVFRATDGSNGYLVHYFLDFGNALGSLGTKPKYPSDGYDPIWSWAVIGELFFSAGLRYRYWLPIQRSPFRSIGFFEADVFEPQRWTPSIPNPAFQMTTARDDFWAAAIIAEFTRPMLKGIVASAAYTNSAEKRYVLDVLWKRRKKILQMAFARVSPLVQPRVYESTIELTDLETREGLKTHIRYRYELRFAGDNSLQTQGENPKPIFQFDIASLKKARAKSPFFTLYIWRIDKDRRGPQLKLHLRRQGQSFAAIGLERESAR